MVKLSRLAPARFRFLFNVSTADAKAPQDVDCDLLEATNDAVNDFLDAEGVQFRFPGRAVVCLYFGMRRFYEHEY